MAKTKDEIDSIIKKYFYQLEDVFSIDKLYLFGSYVSGTPNKDSDIDVAVVSEDFKYMNEFIALKILGKLRKKVDLSIEPLAYTSEDLINPPLGTVEYAIVKEGKLYRF